VDVTALDVMDSFATRTLRDIAHMIRLRGAETVIVGIQPEVAFSMVQLGLTLEEVVTRLDFEEGIAYLNSKKAGERTRNSGRHSRAERHERERFGPCPFWGRNARVEIRSYTDIVAARQKGRAMATVVELCHRRGRP